MTPVASGGDGGRVNGKVKGSNVRNAEKTQTNKGRKRQRMITEMELDKELVILKVIWFVMFDPHQHNHLKLST